MSVRVWRIDPVEIRDRLSAWGRELLARDPCVMAVVLFGSLARGQATAASDADVLVLLSRSPLAFDERLLRYRPRDLGIGVDVFPYTLDEARDALADRWGMVEPAFREGVVLAQRDGAWDRFKAEHGTRDPQGGAPRGSHGC